MTTINVSEECGNAPKKRVLRDLNIAFAENDAEFILDTVADDVKWTTVGDEEIRGRDGVADALKRMQDADVSELTIHDVITHGTAAAVDGELKMADGATHAFCDVYGFTSHARDAKIRSIRSYVHEVSD
ncbi:nuclear transport factor 2 family protein [Halegenticoccus tardaugens]|uniref:nuclear transport factor 2 family protein n=1 Tax=Halegenticoccus tardaugens TaxID=2071624 RepID=UPI00100A79DD|nr:nuclear transport factor 2 family protein [Halegenticoccus tardaugens]